MSRAIASVVFIAAIAGAAAAEPVRFQKAQHPFMLWNAGDLAALKQAIEKEPWARQAYQRLGESDHQGIRSLYNLLQYRLYGDTDAADAEVKRLMQVVGSPVPRGGAQWINILRYDMLFDRLSDEQKRQFEQMARVYIDHAVFKRSIFDPKVFNDSRNFSRYDARVYTRSNWLPNITWPRRVSANLLAVALQDEELIRRTWGHYGSWKWYFDEYLADHGFYAEEFSKMGATPGAMLVYCIAVERLGLNELGFGYRGRGGATMRGHIQSLIDVTYPKVDLGSERPQWPMMTMGDLRQGGSSQGKDFPTPAFQHALVVGFMPDGEGGNVRWRAHGAWGGEVRGDNPQWDGYSNFTPKMQIPLWFELAAKRWPQDGYAYFLAQMREPGQDRYIPSLLFGLEPIDPAKVSPPPAPSNVWPQRGIAMLRAIESPDYWTSDAPSVGVRLAAPYAHSTRDSFAMLGLFAFNRPIYLNRQVTPGYASGWSRSVQSHAGILLDGKEPAFTSDVQTRHRFAGPVKVVTAASEFVYPGVTTTRSWMLTREYLFDATQLLDEAPHEAAWFVHALGKAMPTEADRWKKAELPRPLEPLSEVSAFEAGADGLTLPIQQVFCGADVATMKLPKSWYEPQVGVVLRLLGTEGLVVYTGQTKLPVESTRDPQGNRVQRDVPSEVGGVTVVATQKGPAIRYLALHEPTRGGRSIISRYEAIAANDTAAGVAIESKAAGWRDRAMVRLSGPVDQPVTLEGDGETFTFVDFAWIRATAETVTVVTDRLDAMRLGVGDARPRLILNGTPANARVENGLLIWPVP